MKEYEVKWMDANGVECRFRCEAGNVCDAVTRLVIDAAMYGPEQVERIKSATWLEVSLLNTGS